MLALVFAIFFSSNSHRNLYIQIVFYSSVIRNYSNHVSPGEKEDVRS
jgi:hypothetical protein